MLVLSAWLAAAVSGLMLSGCGPEPPQEAEEHGAEGATHSGAEAAARPATAAPDSAPAEDWSDETRGLYYDIPVTVRFSPASPTLQARVWAYLEHVDQVFNDYRDDTEVGRINAASLRAKEAAPGAANGSALVTVEVSGEFAEALRLAQELHRQTAGAFDVSVGPLRRLWKGAAQSGRLPTDEQLAAARAVCGLDKVQLRDRRLTLAPGVQLDFGGVIKGLAVDHVVEMLKEGKTRAALVQVGGETAVFGISPRGQRHVLGVQHPADLNALWTTLADPGSGLAVSSSGNYRLPIVIGGQAFYHIYDPRTGRPADTRTLAVTVAFPKTGRNGLADGLATASVVLGPDVFLPLMKKLGGEALILTQEGDRIREHKTAGWDKLVRKE